MARKRKHHEDPETPDTETPDTEIEDESELDTPRELTAEETEAAHQRELQGQNHVGKINPDESVSPPNPGLARPGGDVLADREHASYHPNEEMGKTAGDRLPTSSAPLLDEDTHDFGPTGGEDRCRKCGKTRAEIGLKVGRKLTFEELNHPDVKDGPLLPPRIR